MNRQKQEPRQLMRSRDSENSQFSQNMSDKPLGKPRPLSQVIFLSVISGMQYYGWYKWIIQEELRHYNGFGWSGTLSLAPFLLGIAVPQALRIFDPDVPGWFGWFSLFGIVWIYIVQFKLYKTVNQLYSQAQMKEPLVVWWLFVPGLNLIVGLRQIHFFPSILGKRTRNNR